MHGDPARDQEHQGKRIEADVFKQTVSIIAVTAKVFFVIQMYLLIIDMFLKTLKLVLAKPIIIKIAKFSTRN